MEKIVAKGVVKHLWNPLGRQDERSNFLFHRQKVGVTRLVISSHHNYIITRSLYPSCFHITGSTSMYTKNAALFVALLVCSNLVHDPRLSAHIFPHFLMGSCHVWIAISAYAFLVDHCLYVLKVTCKNDPKVDRSKKWSAESAEFWAMASEFTILNRKQI